MKRRVLLAVAVAVVTATRLATPAQASGATTTTTKPTSSSFVLGSGAASAFVTKARVFYAGYSLAVPLGLAATTYENKQSRALGSAYDISAVLGLDNLKDPKVSPYSIDSNAGDAHISVNPGAGNDVGHVELTARPIPMSQSEVHLADVDLPGIAHISGGHSLSTTAVVDGKERTADASVTVAQVSLAGGLVTLDGLHWTASQHSGATNAASVSFSLDKLLIGGAPVATNLTSLDPVFNAVNTALAPTGLVIEPPEVVKHTNGSVEIGGLNVGILNSPLGAKYLSPLIAKLRPSLLPAFDTLSKVDDTLGLAALVADLGLGVADGSGGVELTVGGATAITDDTTFDNPFGDANAGGVSLAPSPLTALSNFSVLPGLSGTLGTPGTQKLVSTSAEPARCVLADGARRQGGCRGANVPGAIAIVAFVVATLATYETFARRRRNARAIAGGSL